MNAVIYSQFKTAIKIAPDKTLARFAMLQIQGGEAAKPILKQIKAVLADNQSTHLLATLALLENDLRTQLAQLSCPVLHIYGESDSLVPSATITAVSELNPEHQIVCIEAAGHLPFLSSPEVFVQAIRTFIQPVVCHG